MMPMKRFVALLTVMLLAVMLSPAAHAQDPAAAIPYIMTWDTDAFTIERADGFDSREFGVGAFAGGSELVRATWSATGEWFFALTSDTINAQPFMTGRLLSVDERQSIFLEPDIVDLTYAWHPSADIILFLTEHSGTATARPEIRAWVYDVNTESVIFEHALPYTEVSLPFTPDQARWLDDTTFAFWHVEQDSAEAPTRLTQFIGTLEAGVFYTQDFSNGHFYLSDTGFIFSEYNGTAFVRHLSDVTTVRELPFSFFSAALTPTEDGILLNMLDGTVQYFDLSGSSVDALEPVQVVADGVFRASGAPYSTGSAWSESGRFAVVTDLSTFEPLLFERTTSSLRPLPVAEINPGYFWSGDTLLILTPPSDNTALNTFDFVAWNPTAASSTATRQTVVMNEYSTPDLDASGTYLAFVNFSVDVVNMASGDLFSTSPDSRSFFTGPYGEVRFHPDLPYFFAFEDALVAGGGAPRYVGVHAVDGSLSRELQFCPKDQVCYAEFLPPQVDVSRLPAGNDLRPQMDARASSRYIGAWSYLSAWNADGTRVALATPSTEGNTVTIYDTTAGAIVETREVDYDHFTQDIAFDGDEIIVVPNLGNGAENAAIATSPQDDGRALVVEGQLAYIVNANGDRIAEIPRVFQTGEGDFSPDGSLLAYNGHLIDTATGEILFTMPYGEVQTMDFSPDGTLLLITAGYRVELWSVDLMLFP